jgi:hypothetical protein
MKRKPPKSTRYYDEPTSFLLNRAIREDIELLKGHFRIRTTGDLMRHLIRMAKEKLN